MPRRKLEPISKEEKIRWGAKEYPKREMLWLRGLLRGHDLELQEILSHEAQVEWLRKKPRGKNLLGPKRSTQKKKDLALMRDQVLEDLRRCWFEEVADACDVANTLPKQVSVLRVFAALQEERYGKMVERPTELVGSPEALMRAFLVVEEKRRTYDT